MALTQPIVFEPLFMERVWGGRRLESLFGKRLPPSARIGESWEIVDREDAQSVVHDGPLQGLTLNELWTQHRDTIFGAGLPDAPRFPLLFKLLDAQERLSVQVHPRPGNASSLGGEPKTEMWYILDALLESDLYAGLRRGVTRADFEIALREGRVAEMIHHFPVKAGDSIFIPSGRIHAIGTGNVIFEVQQNSDTTYRVFDWNRLGLDCQPRALHIEESLQSIDFDDFEPTLAPVGREELAACDYFRVEKWSLPAPRASHGRGRFALFCVTDGAVECSGREFRRGDFFLIPATVPGAELKPLAEGAAVLRTTIP
ncbi:MAG: type I phosphomannose isomerase catalytic subunit [Chthoniobacteraceae bacterium]